MAVWKVYCDGAARGQGSGTVTQAALGVVITRNDKVVWGFARGLGSVTNNVAEYEAVLAGLLMCWSSDDIKDPLIYSDSQLVVNQVNGKWSCNAKALIPLHFSIQQIAKDYRFRLFQVPRNVVSAADKLVNEFLDELTAEHPTLSQPAPKVALLPPPI
jgi:ribonuclease HI